MSTQTEQPFVKASQDEADPVGRIGDDWGFWNEYWTDWIGGCTDEAGARAALAKYVVDNGLD